MNFESKARLKHQIDTNHMFVQYVLILKKKKLFKLVEY